MKTPPSASDHAGVPLVHRDMRARRVPVGFIEDDGPQGIPGVRLPAATGPVAVGGR
jgi:hypothetical protein